MEIKIFWMSARPKQANGGTPMLKVIKPWWCPMDLLSVKLAEVSLS